MSKEMILVPTNDELSVYQLIAKTAAQSQLYAKIGGETGLLSIMLMARELGIPPMQALTSMSMIQGKVEVSPRLMNMMIRKAGHRLDILECSETSCKIKGTRNDTKEEYTCSYTIDEARKAGLVRSGGGWEKYASDMLFARCLSRLARRLFADVISSAYVEGEISDAEYVDRAERVQLSGNSEKLSRLQSVTDSKPEPVVEEAVVKETLITVPEFIEKIRDLAGPDLALGYMEFYLGMLESEKGVKVNKIMEQALSPTLTPRFIKGYKSWMNARLETNSITEEAMKK